MLGKGQEVTRLLTDAGHSGAAASADVSRSARFIALRRRSGRLPSVMPAQPLPGHAVVVPPRMHRGGRLPAARIGHFCRDRLGHARAHPQFGWASTTPFRSRTTPTTTSCSRRSSGSRRGSIYCTHGPASFVDCLRAAGHNAHPLEGSRPDTRTGRPAIVAVLRPRPRQLLARPPPRRRKAVASRCPDPARSCPLVARCTAMLHF